jgi:hypothetical protein
VRLRLARIVDPRTARETLVATPLRRGAGALNALVQTEAMLRIPIGTAGFATGAEVRAVPIVGAAFPAMTTMISGLRSPATDVLVELCHHGIARGSVHWTESGARDACEALATGLCHGAALALDHGAEADPIAALIARVGAVTVLEIARTSSTSEVLVLPGRVFDSPPIVALRTVLRSPDFRCRLLGCDGYSLAVPVGHSGKVGGSRSR